MFGYRKDGKKLKKIDPIIRLTSYIMPERNDAQVESFKDVNCTALDSFIRAKAEEGEKFNYMHVVIAATVRMFALRPHLNRFIMNGRVYARDKIYISFAVKKSLSDDGEETTIKLGFTGHESLYDVRQMINDEIKKANVIKEENKTDKIAAKLLSLPHFVLNPTVKFLKWMDRRGILPKSILEASPFHTSCFLTNLKSIGSDAVLHHLYNFGTTGMFIAMGKEKFEPIVNRRTGQIESAKIMKVGINIDERLCDGFYYVKSLKQGIKFMEKPQLLEERLESVILDSAL